MNVAHRHVVGCRRSQAVQAFVEAQETDRDTAPLPNVRGGENPDDDRETIANA
jgi:hypothetical protein